MKTTQLITLLALFTHLNVFSQYYWKNYTNSVIHNDVEQLGDDMYFATQGGLIKYHIPTGEKEYFLNYNSPVKGKEIVDLAKAPDGSLWVGTNGGGIYKYLDGVWTNYRDHIDADHNTSENITVVNNDEIWFYLQKGGCTVCNKLFRLKDDVLKEFTGFDLDAKGWTFMNFAIKDNDNLWLIYQNQVSIYNISQQKNIKTFEKSMFTADANSVLQYIGKDKSGNILIHTNGGIYKYENETWQPLLQPGFTSIRAVEDTKGNYYFNAYSSAGKKYSILFFDGTQLKEIDFDKFPKHEYDDIVPEIIYVDEEDNLWFEIYNHPLKPIIFLLKDNEWKAIETTIFPIPSNYMRKVVTDCENNVWLLGSGCTKKSGDTYTPITFTDSTAFHGVDMEVDPVTCGIWVSNGVNSFKDDAIGLVYLENNTRKSFLKGHYNVYDVEIDNNRVVYVNSWGHGLGIMKDGNWQWFNSNNSLIKSPIKHLSLDEYNNLYISTRDNGLLMYDGNKFYSLGYGNPSSLKSHWNYVDNDGNIWMTNDHGLSMFNGLDWIDYTDVYGYDVISAMVQDKRGNYWISTWRDGLHYWDKQSITKYTSENSGVRTNYVYNVHLSKTNEVWLTEYIGATSLSIYSYGDKNKVTGISYYDKDKSGTYEKETELLLPGQKVINNDNNNITFTNINGKFTHYLDESATKANLEIHPVQPWVSTTSSVVQAEIPQSEETAFGLYTPSLPQNVELEISSSLPICFADFNVWVTVINKSLEPVSGTLNLSFNEFLKIQLVSDGIDVVNDSTISASLTNLHYLEAITFRIVISAPGEQYLGSPITFNALYTSGSYSKEAMSRETILCAYDPNDKKAEATGDFFENYSLIKDPIKYTIRFENEGNYKASNIIITDTLDDHLDPSTFQFITSSHSCETYISRGKEVKFIFSDINLPPHTEGSTDNQGFVSYKIAPYANTGNYSEIKNKAYIFFDSNTPIVTNTTSSMVVDDLYILSNQDQAINHIRVYPNPSDGRFSIETELAMRYEIYTSLGQLCHKNHLTPKTRVDVKLNSGLYFMTVYDDESSENRTYKLIVH